MKAAPSVRVADHADRTRQAMQRASSVHKKRSGGTVARKDMKAVVVYLSPEAKDMLVGLAHDQRKSVQSMGVEAFNLLFEAYRVKPIA